MRTVIFFFVCATSALCCRCQNKNERFRISKEKIKLVKLGFTENVGYDKYVYSIIGNSNNKISISRFDSLGRVELFLFDEKTSILSRDTESIELTGNKVIRLKRLFDKIFLLGYYQTKTLEEFFEHQDFWIQYKKRTVKFDSFPYNYIDKYFQVNFSSNGQYIICNPYTDVTAGYDHKEDGKVYVYDLRNINVSIIKKQTLNCERCLNVSIIKNNYFLYTKELPIGRGYDGFYKNVYSAPINNIGDTTRIANEINIKLATPDGNFFLGEKYLYGRNVPVIVNVKTKKYQFILGRDYPLDQCYYSTEEEKFAFQYKKNIVYVEFPDEYPFNALDFFSTKSSTKVEREAFWQKFEQRSFE
jgi:hypothetical protein